MPLPRLMKSPTITPSAITPVRGPPEFRTKEELLETISASRLGTWLSCRLKFYFRYLSGICKAPTPAMHVGTVIHAVLQQWNLSRWSMHPLASTTITNLFDALWSSKKPSKEIRWENTEGEIKASAFALLQTYLRDTPIPLNEKPEGVEVAVEMDLSRYGLPTLVGIIDLVRSGGRIVDFKNTSRTPDPQKILHTTEVQTTAYALLYREATDQRESGIELHHLVRLKNPKLVVTQAGPASAQQFSRLFRLIESYTRELEHEDFVPAPGLQCSHCEYFGECRRWS